MYQYSIILFVQRKKGIYAWIKQEYLIISKQGQNAVRNIKGKMICFVPKCRIFAAH